MFFQWAVQFRKVVCSSWYEIMINSILYGPLEYSWQTNMSIDLFILAEIVRIIFLSSHKNFHVLLQFYVQYYYNIHVSQSYQISAILYVLIMFGIRSPKHFLWCNWCFEGAIFVLKTRCSCISIDISSMLQKMKWNVYFVGKECTFTKQKYLE